MYLTIDGTRLGTPAPVLHDVIITSLAVNCWGGMALVTEDYYTP